MQCKCHRNGHGGVGRGGAVLRGRAHPTAGAVQPAVPAGGLAGADEDPGEAGGRRGGRAAPHAQHHPRPVGKRQGVRPRSSVPQVRRGRRRRRGKQASKHRHRRPLFWVVGWLAGWLHNIVVFFIFFFIFIFFMCLLFVRSIFPRMSSIFQCHSGGTERTEHIYTII